MNAPEHAVVDSFRQLLLAKKSEVMASMGMKFDTAAKMGRVAEDDAAQIAQEESIGLQLNKLGYENLRLVDEALDRMQTGEYGVCLRCEETISAKRLAVVPWAKYCVRCQERISSRAAMADDPAVHSVW